MNMNEKAAEVIDTAISDAVDAKLIVADVIARVTDDATMKFAEQALADGLPLTSKSLPELSGILADSAVRSVNGMVKAFGIDAVAAMAGVIKRDLPERIVRACYPPQVQARVKTLANARQERMLELHRKTEVHDNPVHNIGLPEMKALSQPAAVSLSAAEALAGINSRQERQQSRKSKR